MPISSCPTFAPQGARQGGDFIAYSKVFDGVLVAKGNPKGIKGVDLSLCGAAAAENTGYFEAPLVGDLSEPGKKAGKAEATLPLFDNKADCIRAIQAGRADTYVNDLNSVDQAVKVNSDKLEKAAAVSIPWSAGLATPKDKSKFRAAVMAAMILLRKDGADMALLKKYNADVNNFKEPEVLTAD